MSSWSFYKRFVLRVGSPDTTPFIDIFDKDNNVYLSTTGYLDDVLPSDRNRLTDILNEDYDKYTEAIHRYTGYGL